MSVQIPTEILIAGKPYNFNEDGGAIAQSVVLEPGASITTGHRVVIEGPARIAGTLVLGNNVEIGSYSDLNSLTTGSGVILGHHVTCEAGSEIGSDSFVGHHSHVKSGANIGNKVGIGAGVTPEKNRRRGNRDPHVRLFERPITGAMIGHRAIIEDGGMINDSAIIGNDVTLEESVAVGRKAVIADGANVRHNTCISDGGKVRNSHFSRFISSSLSRLKI